MGHRQLVHKPHQDYGTKIPLLAAVTDHRDIRYGDVAGFRGHLLFALFRRFRLFLLFLRRLGLERAGYGYFVAQML